MMWGPSANTGHWPMAGLTLDYIVVIINQQNGATRYVLPVKRLLLDVSTTVFICSQPRSNHQRPHFICIHNIKKTCYRDSLRADIDASTHAVAYRLAAPLFSLFTTTDHGGDDTAANTGGCGHCNNNNNKVESCWTRRRHGKWVGQERELGCLWIMPMSVGFRSLLTTRRTLGRWIIAIMCRGANYLAIPTMSRTAIDDC